MRALVIDPALHSRGGHHYNAAERLLAELRRLDVDARCLASASADGQVTGALSARPVFTQSVYGRSYAAGEFAEAVDRADRELSKALGRLGGLPDMVVLPCCDAVLAAALARQIRRAWWRSPPRLVAWILYGPHHLKAPDDPAAAPQQAESRRALADLLAAVGRERLHTYCETPALAAYYGALTGWTIGVMPGPGLATAGPGLPERPPAGRFTVSCIGFANRAKGYDLLPGAIDCVLQRRRDVGFAIHAIVEGTDAGDLDTVFRRLEALGEAVAVQRGVLSADAYLGWLARSDLLLLPYDPAVYRARGSGVFTDARRQGLPVIATRGCGFAQPAFDGGWGVVMESHSAEGLANAILAALDGLAALTVRARAAAALVRDDLGGLLASVVERGRPVGLAARIRRAAARIAQVRLESRCIDGDCDRHVRLNKRRKAYHSKQTRCQG